MVTVVGGFITHLQCCDTASREIVSCLRVRSVCCAMLEQKYSLRGIDAALNPVSTAPSSAAISNYIYAPVTHSQDGR